MENGEWRIEVGEKRIEKKEGERYQKIRDGKYKLEREKGKGKVIRNEEG